MREAINERVVGKEKSPNRRWTQLADEVWIEAIWRTTILMEVMLGLSHMGPPWLALSTFEGKAKGPGPWPLKSTNCLFVPNGASPGGIETRTKPYV